MATVIFRLINSFVTGKTIGRLVRKTDIIFCENYNPSKAYCFVIEDNFNFCDQLKFFWSSFHQLKKMLVIMCIVFFSPQYFNIIAVWYFYLIMLFVKMLFCLSFGMTSPICCRLFEHRASLCWDAVMYPSWPLFIAMQTNII